MFLLIALYKKKMIFLLIIYFMIHISAKLVDYNDAVEYKNKRRVIAPAIYNQRRLLEEPIPQIQLNADVDFELESDISSCDENENETIGKP